MCQTNKMGCHQAVKHWGLLGLRLAIGFIVAYLGYGKLGANHAGTVAMMAGIGGAGAAEFLAYLVGTLEFVGGLMMIGGVYAPLAAGWQGIILLVAMLTVHRGGPLMGYFLPLAVLGGCLGIVAAGAGKFRLVRQQCPCPACKAGCMMCGTGEGGGCGDGGGCGCGGGSCGDHKMGEMKMGTGAKQCSCGNCCGGHCGCGMPGGSCGCCK